MKIRASLLEITPQGAVSPKGWSIRIGGDTPPFRHLRFGANPLGAREMPLPVVVDEAFSEYRLFTLQGVIASGRPGNDGDAPARLRALEIMIPTEVVDDDEETLRMSFGGRQLNGTLIVFRESGFAVWEHDAEPAQEAFCSTGKGGGVDNSCPSKSGGGAGGKGGTLPIPGVKDGLPKSEMPRIPHRAADDFERYLRDEDAYGGLRTDVDPSTLKPLQRDYKPEVVKFLKSGTPEAEASLARPIYITRDGYILDGHHTWMAAKDMGRKVTATVIDADRDSALKIAQRYEAPAEFREPRGGWTSGGEAFCPTGPGGGQDNSCAPGYGAGRVSIKSGDRTFEYQPMTDYALSTSQRKTEERLGKRLATQEADDAYAVMDGTEGGKRLDVDLYRKLSSEYDENNDSRTLHTLSTHQPSSAKVEQRYNELLAEPPNGHVLFMAGGGGSGKSTISDGLMAAAVKKSDVIMDGVMSNEQRAVRQIEAALKSGREVKIAYVHRPFESAMQGVKKRYENEVNGGRWVPGDELAKAHVKAQETIIAVARKYKDDPRVKIRVFENPDRQPGSTTKPREISLDKRGDFRYTKSGLGSATSRKVQQAIERFKPVARKYIGNAEKKAAELAGRGAQESEKRTLARGVEEGFAGPRRCPDEVDGARVLHPEEGRARALTADDPAQAPPAGTPAYRRLVQSSRVNRRAGRLYYRLATGQEFEHTRLLAAFEFSDRYQALGIPLPDPNTICKWLCEGTGWVPIKGATSDASPRADMVESPLETDTELMRRWVLAEERKHAEDGWHFVLCPICEGTGKITPAPVAEAGPRPPCCDACAIGEPCTGAAECPAAGEPIEQFVLDGYDAAKLTDEQLADDWRLVADKFAIMANGGRTEFKDANAVEDFATAIVREIIRRGKTTFEIKDEAPLTTINSAGASAELLRRALTRLVDKAIALPSAASPNKMRASAYPEQVQGLANAFNGVVHQGHLVGFVRHAAPTEINTASIGEALEIHGSRMGLTSEQIAAMPRRGHSVWVYPVREFIRLERARKVSAPQTGIGDLRYADNATEAFDLNLADLSNMELVVAHGTIHREWEDAWTDRREEHPQDVVDRHARILREMQRRGLEHRPKDMLDQLTEKYAAAEIGLAKAAGVLTTPITLRKPFLSIVGGLPIEGNGANLDLWVNWPAQDAEFLRDLATRIKGQLPPEWTLNLIAEMKNPTANHIPIADLVVSVRPAEEREIQRMSRVMGGNFVGELVPEALREARASASADQVEPFRSYFYASPQPGTRAGDEPNRPSTAVRYLEAEDFPVRVEPLIEGVRLFVNKVGDRLEIEDERGLVVDVNLMTSVWEGLLAQPSDFVAEATLELLVEGARRARGEIASYIESGANDPAIDAGLRLTVSDILWIDGRDVHRTDFVRAATFLARIRAGKHVRPVEHALASNRGQAVALITRFRRESAGAVLKSGRYGYDLGGGQGGWWTDFRNQSEQDVAAAEGITLWAGSETWLRTRSGQKDALDTSRGQEATAHERAQSPSETPPAEGTTP